MSNVSVIMANKNNCKTLSFAIESILLDLDNEDEFIIIDDGSTDDSLRILKYYEDLDSRIKLYTNSHSLGLPYSLNLAVDKSSFNLICRMDADDINILGRVSELKKVMKDNIFSVVGTFAESFSNEGDRLQTMSVPLGMEEINATMVFDSAFIHPSVIFNKEDFLSIGGYNTDFVRCQDYELWSKFIQNGFKVCNLRFVGLKYRLSPHQNRDKINERFKYSNLTRKSFFQFATSNNKDSLSDLHCFISGDVKKIKSLSCINLMELARAYFLMEIKVDYKLILKIILRKSLKRLYLKPHYLFVFWSSSLFFYFRR
ncbi:glycosyltransferase [Vibrio parahaemolyticus]|nr:glycosyltransferase [Vibrio parahaemolyticus]MDF4334965.1 glycosyltransferase [Vibrio parahaemolyticus]